MTRLRTDRRKPRRGFTMVELMVVVGLIVFLMSISIAVLGSAIGIARQRATQATILKIHGLMQQRVDAFNRAMERTNLQPAMDKLVRDLGIPVRRAREDKFYQVLAKKQIFQSRFPQNFSERDISTLTSTFVSANHNKDTESSALLYWLLTNSEVFGISPVDDSEFSSNEVRDTDSDGLLEFVDGWGRPLRFYRWPTQLFRPGTASIPAGVTGSGTPTVLSTVDRTYASLIWSGLPAAPIAAGDLDPLTRDPDDPTGQIMRYVKNSAASNQTTVMTTIQNRFHTPDTFHAFLIMSAGPDGKMGLGEPWNPVISGLPSPSTQGSMVITTPTLDLKGQGRLAAVSTYSANPVDIVNHPLNDNISNRKR